MTEEQNNLPPLPKDWIWTTSSEVCSSVRDGTHDTPKYVQQGLPLITSKNLKPDGLDFSKTKNISLEDHEKIGIRSKVEERDILFAMIGTIGNPVVVNTKREFSIKNVGVFKKNEQIINSDFLRFWLSSSTFMKIIRDRKLLRGTTQKFISLGKLRSLPIPLSPLNEQRRIICKLEELFSRLDAGVASSHNVKAQLELYRQAVLKHAFNGRLTEEWRKNHKNTIQPVTKLLEQFKHKEKNKGKIKESIKNVGLELPELPETWTWTRLVEIAEVNPKLSFDTVPNNMEVSFLPMKAVEAKTGNFSASITKQYSKVKKKGYTSFMNGDILFAKITPCMENGKIAIVTNLKNGIGFGSTEFHVVRLLNNDFSKKYVFYYLLQEKFRKEARHHMKGTAGQLRVPKVFMENTIIPLPSISEQRRISDEIENRFSVIMALDKVFNQVSSQSERLRQSILKRAFEGKLVAQDPTDESAEELIESIKKGKKREIRIKKSRIKNRRGRGV